MMPVQGIFRTNRRFHGLKLRASSCACLWILFDQDRTEHQAPKHLASDAQSLKCLYLSHIPDGRLLWTHRTA